MSSRKSLFKKKDRDRWAVLVGRFILAFGGVENVTYLFLRNIPSDKLHETASKLPLGRRIDLVIELLSAQTKLSDKRKEQFTKVLRQAKSLSERRNVLAHSPLVIEGWHHPKYGWFKPTRILIGSVKTKEKVTARQLRTQVGQAERLAERMYGQYSLVYRSIVARRSV